MGLTYKNQREKQNPKKDKRKCELCSEIKMSNPISVSKINIASNQKMLEVSITQTPIASSSLKMKNYQNGKMIKYVSFRKHPNVLTS